MTYTAKVLHGEGVVTLKIDCEVSPRKKMRPNWGGLPSPSEPPSVGEIYNIEIEDDELGRNLDPDLVWEEHDEEIAKQIIDQEANRYARKP